MTPELLPCPFCGGAAAHHRYGVSQHIVSCGPCDLHLAPQESAAEAIAAWNKRTLTDEMVERGATAIFVETKQGPKADDSWPKDEVWKKVWVDYPDIRKPFLKQARACLTEAIRATKGE